MLKNTILFGFVLAFFMAGSPAMAAADGSNVPERSEGKADAPVVIQEFVSFTCPHCAMFYKDILPAIEKDYIESGKVRIILRDSPMDGTGLRAAALARCMPENQYFPFVKVLFSNQATWVTATDPDKLLIQYATFSGLPADKAKACLDDKAMQEGIVALSEQGSKKYNVTATPTFIINDGAEKVQGPSSPKEITSVVDKILAAPKGVTPVKK